MRLDKYLKVARIIKRRTLANEACTKGLVKLNGREAKASADVKAGDMLEIRFGQRVISYEILKITEHALKEDASEMYRQITQSGGGA